MRRVTWCAPLLDIRAAYMAGTPPVAWLRWACRCEAISALHGTSAALPARDAVGRREAPSRRNLAHG